VHCITCGMESDEDDRFCGYCGNTIASVAGKKNRQVWLMILSTVGFFFLTIFWAVVRIVSGIGRSLEKSQAEDNVADLEVKFHIDPTRQNAKDLARAKERLAVARKKGN
jgi:predicted nucleic acid-binding Zn ribbon protein